MGKNRIKRLCETLIETLDIGVTITEFIMIPTFKYDDESSKWVPNSFSLFIQIKSSTSSDYPHNIQSKLESYLGFECCVDFA
jgi:hypothetical protein